jgi:DNA-binding response OmpR family regulator
MTDVVVVDDSPIVLRTLGMVLEREGFSVECASDGEEGLGTIQRARPPLVFLDAMMPGLDGYEVCRRIRLLDGDGRRTHVIMLTGSSDEHDRVRADAAGVDEFMTKPFSPTGVVERVHDVLDGHDAG